MVWEARRWLVVLAAVVHVLSCCLLTHPFINLWGELSLSICVSHYRSELPLAWYYQYFTSGQSHIHIRRWKYLDFIVYQGMHLCHTNVHAGPHKKVQQTAMFNTYSYGPHMLLLVCMLRAVWFKNIFLSWLVGKAPTWILHMISCLLLEGQSLKYNQGRSFKNFQMCSCYHSQMVHTFNFHV